MHLSFHIKYIPVFLYILYETVRTEMSCTSDVHRDPDRDNMMPAAEPQTGQGAGERRALCTRTVQGAAPLFTEQATIPNCTSIL